MTYSVRELFFLTLLLTLSLTLPDIPARAQGISIGEGGVTIGGPLKKEKKRHHKKHHKKKPDVDIGIGVTIDPGKLLKSGESDKSKTRPRGKPKTPPAPTTVTEDKPKTTTEDTSVATTTSDTICGPDITDKVLEVLDKIHSDWNDWDQYKKAEKCRDLLNPMTAEGAWDIVALSPKNNPRTPKEWEEIGKGTSYESYLKGNKFWFEKDAARCAIPRPICGRTVTFLGKCIDAQVVNYVQWGTMNRLCVSRIPAQEFLAAGAYRARNMAKALLDEPVHEHIQRGQELMTSIGQTYTTLTGRGKAYAHQSANDEKRDAMKSTLTNAMAFAEAADKIAFSAGFAARPEAVCKLPCPMTDREKKNLAKQNWNYHWGAYSIR